MTKGNTPQVAVDFTSHELRQATDQVKEDADKAEVRSIGWAEGMARNVSENSEGWAEGMADEMVEDSKGWAEGFEQAETVPHTETRQN